MDPIDIRILNKIPSIKFYENCSVSVTLFRADRRLDIIRLIIWVRFASELKIQSAAGQVNAFKFIVTIKVQNNILYAPPYKTNVVHYLFPTDLEESVQLFWYPYLMAN
jgi:hypothetical protein